MEETVFEQLNWRYATKKFDTSKKLNPQQIDGLLTAIQLAPTSYGLQPFKVLVVSNPAIREQLKLPLTDKHKLRMHRNYWFLQLTPTIPKHMLMNMPQILLQPVV